MKKSFFLIFLIPFAVNAAAPDYSTLTSSVDFSSVITAIISISAALAGVGIVMKGTSLILRKLGIR
jgi:hypothetical protein